MTTHSHTRIASMFYAGSETTVSGYGRRSVIDTGSDAADGTRGLGERIGAALADGPGALVIGAIGFDPEHSSRLVVPERVERVARHRDGVQGTAVVGTTRHRSAAPRFTAAPDEARFGVAVAAAVERIRAGRLDKVVLARTLAAELPEDIDPRVFVHAVLAANPSAFGFALDLSRGTGAHLFFGASPELLVRRSGLRIRSVPLAGSLPRSADPLVDAERARALAASSKDLLEHAFVVDAITERLRPLCRELSVPARPTVLATPRMWHLATDIEGVLRDSSVSAADLALALHPTPAVGGAPTAEALATIGELEPRARGLYAGAVGWTDSTGDGEWAVAIRSAEVVGRTLRLFAGAGVVAESTPEGEIAETAAKFRTLLDAIGGGTPGGEAAPRRAQMSTSKSSTPSKPSPAARSAAK